MMRTTTPRGCTHAATSFIRVTRRARRESIHTSPATSRIQTLPALLDFPRPLPAWRRPGEDSMKTIVALMLAIAALLIARDARAQAAFPPPPPKVSPAAGVIDM